jgi:hypothetical protein
MNAIWLFILFVILQGIDYYTTGEGLKREQVQESNPAIKKLMDKYGIDRVMQVKTLLDISIGIYIFLMGFYVILAIVDVFYIFVAVNNFRTLAQSK